MSFIRLESLSKYFPASGHMAVDEVSLELAPATIYAIVGENGAGKSTLLNMLSGLLRPSSGRIFLEGREARFKSPADALAGGIAMLHQHPLLVPDLNLIENCLLGAEGRAILPRGGLPEGLVDYARRLDLYSALKTKARHLSANQRHKAALLACLARDPRLLILDEPTDALAPQEAETLFAIAREMASDSGATVLIVTHRLDSALSLASKLFVMRQGRLVGKLMAKDCEVGELNALMVGRDDEGSRTASSRFAPSGAWERLGQGEGPTARESRENTRKETLGSLQNASPRCVFSARDISLTLAGRKALKIFSFELYEGEILAITGIREEGPAAVEEIAGGMLEPESGDIALFGEDFSRMSAREKRLRGFSYLPSDRMGRASMPRGSVADNLVCHETQGPSRGIFLDRVALEKVAVRMIETSGTAVDPSRELRRCSGGSIQRLILARELDSNPRVAVLAEPGWGLDHRSRESLRRALRGMAARGSGILLITSDIDEALGLGNKVLVLRDGALAGEYLPSEATKRGEAESLREARLRIGELMLGLAVAG